MHAILCVQYMQKMANTGGGSLRHDKVSSERLREAASVPSRSACITKLEREVKELRGENSRLKEELSSIKSLYDQLVFEAPREQFSQRRVHLLKSQLFLVERQMSVQNQALQSRARLLTDLAALLDYVLECARREENSHNKEKEGREKMIREEKRGFSEAEIDTLLEKAQAMRARISRCNHMHTSTAAPLVFPYLPPSLLAPSTDVCTCGQDGSARVSVSQLNLKYVSSLESELAQLYGNLTQLHSSLQSLPSRPPSSCPPPSHPPSSPPTPSSSLLGLLTDHQQQLVKVTSDLLADCCHHLLTISLLAPSCQTLPFVPKCNSTGSASDTCTIDSLLSRLKPHTRNRKEVKEIVQEVVKSVNHAALLQVQKSSALERELDFHRSVYQLQVNYVSSLFEAVRSGYETFEEAAQDLVCTPLEDILVSYSEFSAVAAEDKLRQFLAKFQEKEMSLRNVVDSLKSSPQDKQNGDTLSPQGGSAALSVFGEQFFESLQQLESECCMKRKLSFEKGLN